MWLLVDGALLLSLTIGCELFLYLRRREHYRDAARVRRIARLLIRDVPYLLPGAGRRGAPPERARRGSQELAA